MLRRLSDMERLIWLIGQVMPISFLMVARIRGEFSFKQLREALRKVRRRHPLLAVRVTRDAEGQPWFTQEGVVEPPVRVVEGVIDDGWITEAKRALLEPFPTATGPLVRFTWLKSADAPDRSGLVAICHHGIADGNSATYLLRDILHHLGHPMATVRPLPLQPACDDLIPARVEHALSQGVISKMEASHSTSVPEARDQAGPARPSPPPPPRYHLRAWSLARSQTASLLDRCRGEQTTVQGALAAAFLPSFAHVRGGVEGSWTGTLQTPITLRDRLSAPIGEDLGMFMSWVTTSVDYTPDRHFWDTARDVTASLHEQLRPEGLFAWVVMFKALGSLASNAEELPPYLTADYASMVTWDLSLSNLGRLAFPTSYGPLRLEALHGPLFAATPGDKVIGVTTFDGRMNLTFISREATIAPSVADQAIDEGMDRLAAMIHW
jgi:hypothetical protein